MAYLYLFAAVMMNATSSVFGKRFNQQCEGLRDTGAFYNFIQLAAAFLCWGILFLRAPSFDLSVLPYAGLFAFFYILGTVGLIEALKYGPAALSTLFMSLSLLLTTGWGFLFWDEEPTLLVGIGLVLVIIAVYLCLKTDKKEEKSVSWRWLITILIAMVGNSGCSVVQRTQQMAYGGEHGNMLMLFAMGGALIFCLIRYLLSDRSDSPVLLRKNGIWPLLAGVCNVALNMLVMLMTFTDLAPSLIYPCMGVGGLMIVCLCSIFLFREKLNKLQWVGMGVGTVAVALLSI